MSNSIFHDISIEMKQFIYILTNTPVPCSLVDENFNIVWINSGFATLFALEQLKPGSSFEILSPAFQPDGVYSIDKAKALMAECFEPGATISFDWLHITSEKKLLPTKNTFISVTIDGKQYLQVFIEDKSITHPAHLDEKLVRQRIQIVIDSCPLACGIVDERFNVLECNREAIELFHLPDKQVFINNFFDLSPEFQPDGQLSKQKALDKLKIACEAGRTHYEWLHQGLDGLPIPCEVTMVRMHMNDSDLVLIYIHDLRALKESMALVEKMESMAFTDALTMLFTRRYFMENAEPALNVSKALVAPYHLIMCDLDHFKNVNDTYGHLVGDEVLKIAAKRMSNVIREGALIARYGGEEFIVMLTDMSYASAVNTAARMQKTIEESRFMISSQSIKVTVSIGVSTLQNPNETLSDLIYKADTALYTAKATGRNKVIEYIAAEAEGILVMK